ncbi:U24-ctenitoxin-Pn1a-like [Centruroides sculpturatus]|uniref:U24-ctenitoxin-Pn1a-like n=1 Tax=Centruroides sculpturatus TaxID=218467 RepID=UPI000C6D2C59|nr:U24-ctenitoxin-Pn1a-like [Centruroides sculpturatus]XP_023238422.1 U24-ctenitoxin-Pn1a-like [Centruroides sculpturatus]XP_023238423.1 U24-ctenitoxin-Pn1a-like [Centruroides sculpturatus]
MKIYLILLIGVALIAISSAQKKSECQEHREKASKSSAPVKVVPICESNGDYAALQCHNEGKFCSCWRKDGTPITQPSTKIKSCVCHRDRDDKLKNSKGATVPECSEDGKFKKKQCSGSSGQCWCVDPETGIKNKRNVNNC